MIEVLTCMYIYIYIYIYFRILSIFNTHTWGEEIRFFKETYSDIYPKGPRYSHIYKIKLKILNNIILYFSIQLLLYF